MSDRPANGCVTHRPPKPGRPWRLADPSYRTCRECCDQLHRWLTPGSTEEAGSRPDGQPILRSVAIPDLYAMLDPRPVVGDSGRRGPGFGSRSPASDHIIAMTDPRSKSCEVARDTTLYRKGRDENGRETEEYVSKADGWRGGDGKVYTEDETPPRSVPLCLASWAQCVAEEREVTAPGRTVSDLAAFLDRNLDWITRQDWVDEFAEDMRQLLAQLRSGTGDGRQPPVGSCIEPLESGECGAPIYMPPGTAPRAPDEPIKDLPSLQCQACGATYDGRRLILLRLANERKTA